MNLLAAVLLGALIAPSEPAEPKLGLGYGDVLALPQPSPVSKHAYGNDPLQYGELWLPSSYQGKSKLPVVVFIHGGCWLNAFDIKHTYTITQAIADLGYAVFSLEYRRTGDKGGGWPGTYHDVLAGIGHLDAIDAPLNLNRVSLMGHSAGGHLAVLAGGAFEHSSINIERVVGLAAITDIAEYSRGSNSCETATPSFMGGETKDVPLAYMAANPAEQPLHPNTVLIQGDADTIVAPDYANLYSATALWVAGGGHFDLIHPQSDAFKLIAQALNDTP